jgi:hypothetical protein
MRLNLRGLTPSKTGMDDRFRDEKGQKDKKIAESKINLGISNYLLGERPRSSLFLSLKN